jgi:hypothetical protein
MPMSINVKDAAGSTVSVATNDALVAQIGEVQASPTANTVLDRLKAIAPQRGTLTDRSGTVTTGSTAQQVAAANASRSYFFFQNVSTSDLWLNFGTPATASQPSIKIVSGASFTFESRFVSTELISVYGATTTQAFTAKEG